MKKKRPLDRKSKPVRDASLVVIASEDTYAVRQYFEFFESTRIQFRVLATEDCNSSPKHVLERLQEFIDDFEIGAGDSFWLVCDCDHWAQSNHIANLVDVLRLCRQKDIQVALSGPCFELWLYLHFADTPIEAELTCADIGTLLSRSVDGFDKAKVYNLPINEENVLAAMGSAALNQLAEGQSQTESRLP